MTRNNRRSQELPSCPPDVLEYYQSLDNPVRDELMILRRLILDVAATTPGVGQITEALKWRQPSFLTLQSKSGSTIRIDQLKARPGGCGIYFHCQTSLVETFRALYPDELRFEGNRAILLHADEVFPEAPLRHCIALALTYHLAKKKTRD